MEQGPVDSTAADARGRFRFRFRADSGAVYLLSARYREIEYFSTPVHLGARPDTAIRLVVYDTSSRHPGHPRRPAPGGAAAGRDRHPRDPRPGDPAQPRRPHPRRAGLARHHLGRHAAAWERGAGSGRERRVAGRSRPPGRLAPRERADRPGREAACAAIQHARPVAGAAAADRARGENQRPRRGGRHPGDRPRRNGGQSADPGPLVPALERRARGRRHHYHHASRASGCRTALARPAGRPPGAWPGCRRVVGPAARGSVPALPRALARAVVAPRDAGRARRALRGPGSRYARQTSGPLPGAPRETEGRARRRARRTDDAARWCVGLGLLARPGLRRGCAAADGDHRGGRRRRQRRGPHAGAPGGLPHPGHHRAPVRHRRGRRRRRPVPPGATIRPRRRGFPTSAMASTPTSRRSSPLGPIWWCSTTRPSTRPCRPGCAGWASRRSGSTPTGWPTSGGSAACSAA